MQLILPTALLGSWTAAFLAALGSAAGWVFVDALAVAPTAFSGGVAVADGASFAAALNLTDVTSIYVQQSIDVGAVFEANAPNASELRYLVGRDLHIYGEPGAAIDFKWSTEVVWVAANVTLTIDGDLRLLGSTRPTLSSMRYNFFLGVFVFDTGATLRLHNTVVEHPPASDPELWLLAGSTDPAYALPALDDRSWAGSDLQTQRLYDSANVLQAMRANLPAAAQPRLSVTAAGDLLLQSWVIDEPTWDLAVFYKLNANQLFGLYDLQNVTLAAPLDASDECNATEGVDVADSASFHAAMIDPATYRIKITKSFTMVPYQWPAQGFGTGAESLPDSIIVTRRLRILGCESAGNFTVLGLDSMMHVVYAWGRASVQWRRVLFLDVFQAPRNDYLAPFIGVLSLWFNATVSLQDCEFVPAYPSVLGPLVNHALVPGSNIQSLLPSFSSALVFTDPVSRQLSVLLTSWQVVVGPFIQATQGNLSVGDVRGSWNYLNCVVSHRPAPLGGSGMSGRLALEIALPLAAFALLLIAAVVACLLWRRRRRKRRSAAALTILGEEVQTSPKSALQGGLGGLAHSGALGAAANGHDSERSASRVGEGSATTNVVDGPVGAAEGCPGGALLKMGKQAFSKNAWDQIRLGACIGLGGFSKVYKGYWRGSVVAVKVIALPKQLSITEKLQRMVVMETAISSSLTHPNIVATYAYAVRNQDHPWDAATPAADGASLERSPSLDSSTGAFDVQPASAQTGPEHGRDKVEAALAAACEVRLVQEYAPWGNLRSALKAGRLCARGDPKGRVELPVVLDVCLDVCKALVHLHDLNIVHCDLKPSNVLLVPSSTSPKGFVAKLADFGVSQSIQAAESVCNVWSGTISYMAPEVLMFGRATRASDIYSLAIVMWEMAARQTVRLACQASMAPFMVAMRGMRPAIPANVPKPFTALIRQCWAGAHERRPSALSVQAALAELLAQAVAGALGSVDLGPPGDALDVDDDDDTAPNTELTTERALPTPDGEPEAAAATAGGGGAQPRDILVEMQDAVDSLGLSTREASARMSSRLSGSGSRSLTWASNTLISSELQQGGRTTTQNDVVDAAPVDGSGPDSGFEVNFCNAIPEVVGRLSGPRASPTDASSASIGSVSVAHGFAEQEVELSAMVPALQRAVRGARGVLAFREGSASMDSSTLSQSGGRFVRPPRGTPIMEPAHQPGEPPLAPSASAVAAPGADGPQPGARPVL